MAASVLRTGVLLLAPAVFGLIHALAATTSDHRATHFVAPTSQSATANQDVADRADISFEVLERRLAKGDVVLIDARRPDEYAEEHIPGAVNYHVEAVEDDVTIITSRLDMHAEIVVYCGSGTCEDSARLFDILTQLLEYTNVRLFHGGMEAWRAAGLPVNEGQSP